MAESNKPRRTVAGSRNPATAPRRIAGRSTRPEVDGLKPEVAQPEAPAPEQSTKTRPWTRREGRPSRVSEESEKIGPTKGAVADREPGALSSVATTKVLIGLLVALLVIGVVEAGVWAYTRVGGDETVQHVLPFDEDYVVSDNPVTVPMADWRDANDAALKGVTEILNVSWKDYDQNLEDARKLITDKFEKEYANTAKDSRDLFLKSKAEYDFAVVGSSVVEATPDEVATLLFLNQFVYKGEGKDRTGPEIYPVRVMVRMVRTDSGWLIDELHAL